MTSIFPLSSDQTSSRFLAVLKITLFWTIWIDFEIHDEVEKWHHQQPQFGVMVRKLMSEVVRCVMVVCKHRFESIIMKTKWDVIFDSTIHEYSGGKRMLYLIDDSCSICRLTMLDLFVFWFISNVSSGCDRLRADTMVGRWQSHSGRSTFVQGTPSWIGLPKLPLCP